MKTEPMRTQVVIRMEVNRIGIHAELFELLRVLYFREERRPES